MLWIFYWSFVHGTKVIIKMQPENAILCRKFSAILNVASKIPSWQPCTLPYVNAFFFFPFMFPFYSWLRILLIGSSCTIQILMSFLSWAISGFTTYSSYGAGLSMLLHLPKSNTFHKKLVNIIDSNAKFGEKKENENVTMLTTQQNNH